MLSFDTMDMLKTSIIVLLLALKSWPSAHARALRNTSSISSAPRIALAYNLGGGRRGTYFPKLPRTLSAPLSVVQDWNLVCEQLCGADLGGPQCDSQCADISLSQDEVKSNADAILNPHKDAICNDLCLLQLGGSTCNCSDSFGTRTIQSRNRVCTTFCEHNESTLAGCSLCLKNSTTKTGDGSGEGESDAESSTSTSTTTTPSTTTPNWNVVCASLCKTGDGGSLCNCDLPPFF